MIWFITLFLCAILFFGLLGIVNPELILPPLANYWRKRAHYRHHH